jgi:hypothetical protein
MFFSYGRRVHSIGQDQGIDDFSAHEASPAGKEHLAALIQKIHKTILHHQSPTTLAKHRNFSSPEQNPTVTH